MALLTAAQVRGTATGQAVLGLTGSSEDTSLDAIIAHAEGLIAAHLNWPAASTTGAPTLDSTAFTFYRDFGRYRVQRVDDLVIRLPHPVVTAITSIHDDPNRAYSSAYLVDSGDYDLFDDGEVVLKDDASHGAWYNSRGSIKAVVTAGYSTAPEWLEKAIAEAVAHFWKQRKTAGQQTISESGVAVTPLPRSLPQSVMDFIGPHVFYGGSVA